MSINYVESGYWDDAYAEIDAGITTPYSMEVSSNIVPAIVKSITKNIVVSPTAALLTISKAITKNIAVATNSAIISISKAITKNIAVATNSAIISISKAITKNIAGVIASVIGIIDAIRVGITTPHSMEVSSSVSIGIIKSTTKFITTISNSAIVGIVKRVTSLAHINISGVVAIPKNITKLIPTLNNLVVLGLTKNTNKILLPVSGIIGISNFLKITAKYISIGSVGIIAEPTKFITKNIGVISNILLYVPKTIQSYIRSNSIVLADFLAIFAVNISKILVFFGKEQKYTVIFDPIQNYNIVLDKEQKYKISIDV